MITVHAPTGDKEAASFTVRTPDGDKAVARILLRTPTGDSEIFSNAAMGDLTVSVSPLSATGSTFNPAAETITTNLVTVTVTGGTAPYSIEWTAGGGSGLWEITNPFGFETRFIAEGVSPGDTSEETFTATVTDARGRTGTTTVPAAVYNFATGGL